MEPFNELLKTKKEREKELKFWLYWGLLGGHKFKRKEYFKGFLYILGTIVSLFFILKMIFDFYNIDISNIKTESLDLNYLINSNKNMFYAIGMDIVYFVIVSTILTIWWIIDLLSILKPIDERIRYLEKEIIKCQKKK